MTDVMETLEQTSPLTEGQLIAALAYKKLKVIGLMHEGVTRIGYNELQKYPYAQASDVKKEVGQAMVAAGLAMRVTMADYERIKLEIMDANKLPPWRLTVRYQIDLIDCETGFVETSFWNGECTLHGNDDKGWNKTSTQAVKYFLLANFLVGTKEDDDRDIDGDGPSRPQQRQNRNNQRPTLTNGRGQPRDVPAARTGNGQAAPSAPAMLSATDEAKWPNFLVWAKEQYGMDEAAVNDAIWQLTKNHEPFNGERDHAVAALLASAAKYDPKFIAATAKGKKLITPDVIQKANEIAKGYTLPE